MKFNIDKCIDIKCSRAKTIMPIVRSYIYYRVRIHKVNLISIHRVIISSTLQWSHHNTDVTNRASTT